MSRCGLEFLTFFFVCKVIVDIKCLLCSAYEESAKELAVQPLEAEKKRISTMFADKVTILAKLTMHLRDSIQQVSWFKTDCEDFIYPLKMISNFDNDVGMFSGK